MDGQIIKDMILKMLKALYSGTLLKNKNKNMVLWLIHTKLEG